MPRAVVFDVELATQRFASLIESIERQMRGDRSLDRWLRVLVPLAESDPLIAAGIRNSEVVEYWCRVLPGPIAPEQRDLPPWNGRRDYER